MLTFACYMHIYTIHDSTFTYTRHSVSLSMTTAHPPKGANIHHEECVRETENKLARGRRCVTTEI